MPRGFIPNPQSEGGNDFFDLKKVGDKAIAVLLGEPFILKVHTLPDASKPYGLMFPCGTEDLGACPVCEDHESYDADMRKTKIKCYYPLFIALKSDAAGVKEKVNAMKVMSGGARLHDGFLAFHAAQTEFGGEVFGKPIIIQRMGEGSGTTYNVGAHPQADLKIPVSGEEPDVEAIATAWIEKTWAGIGYKPAGMKTKPSGTQAVAPDEPDPFDSL